MSCTHHREGSDAHIERREQVMCDIEAQGFYELDVKELNFGARTAWRNSSKCIGRKYWKKLQVRQDQF